MDPIVKDSSIWNSAETFQAVSPRDTSIKLGTVREIQYNEKLDDVRYVVEVSDDNNTLPVLCIPITRWGGAHNFEEYTLRGYKAVNNPIVDLGPPANKPGDSVIVGYLGGDGRQGVILGTVKHPGRKRKLTEEDGSAYSSEFNGLQTEINKDGEWTLTFNGLAINDASLDLPPIAPVKAPKFNKVISGTYMMLDKTGSWEVNDAETTLGEQSIRIDKPKGTTTITSGDVVIVIDKKLESVTTTCKEYTKTATDKITETTKEYSLEATKSISQKTLDYSLTATKTFKVKSPKIAIGTGGIEVLAEMIALMEQIVQLTTNLSTETHIGNLGAPSTPPLNAAAYAAVGAQVGVIKAKIQSIKGSL